jgi:hypothetical protein
MAMRQVLLVMVFVGVGFLILEMPFRLMEVALSGGLLAALHVPDVLGTSGVDMFVHHAGTSQEIELILAPQCSSLPAVLAIFGLAYPMARVTGPRIYKGAALASAIALVGNIVRTDAVIFVGVFFGFIALVLFHTWVAAIFDFAAVLLGWILMVRMQLPADRDVAGSGRPGPPPAAGGPAGRVLPLSERP